MDLFWINSFEKLWLKEFLLLHSPKFFSNILNPIFQLTSLYANHHPDNFYSFNG